MDEAWLIEALSGGGKEDRTDRQTDSQTGEADKQAETDIRTERQTDAYAEKT